MRETSQRDLASVKSANQDLSLRETKLLRELQTSLENENNNYKRKIELSANEMMTLNKEIQLLKAVRESEVGQLRGELRLKSFECSSLGSAFEERGTQLRAAVLQVETQAEEITAHKYTIL